MQDAARDWIGRYLAHLEKERRLSPHTVSGYRRDLDALAAWLDERGIASWADISHPDIRMFAATQHRRGLGPRSVARRLAAVRGFFNFLMRERELQANPANEVSAPKAPRKLPGTLDVDLLGRLLAIEGDDPVTCRDRAILELFYSSGLRLAELCTLELNDLDLRDGLVRVTGKGSKTRVLPVGRKASSALERWLKVRGQLAADDVTTVFVGQRGQPIHPRTVQQRLVHWAKRQGIGTKLHPHLLRHSFASHLLESSGDLRAVQELLGHADISTTQIYTHLDFQHLAGVYDKAHPRARRREDEDENGSD